MSGFNPARDKFGPRPRSYRRLRFFETRPDRYVEFSQSQRQWAFSYNHPLLWAAYQVLARLRCRLRGHEFSTLWEADKFVPDPETRTHCLFCGEEIIAPAGRR